MTETVDVAMVIAASTAAFNVVVAAVKKARGKLPGEYVELFKWVFAGGLWWAVSNSWIDLVTPNAAAIVALGFVGISQAAHRGTQKIKAITNGGKI